LSPNSGRSSRVNTGNAPKAEPLQRGSIDFTGLSEIQFPPGCCDSDPAHHSWQLEDNALTFAPHVAAGPKL